MRQLATKPLSWEQIQQLQQKLVQQNKLSPANRELERSILATMALNANACSTALSLIGAVDGMSNPFVEGIHPRIYEVIYTLVERNEAVDGFSIMGQLRVLNLATPEIVAYITDMWRESNPANFERRVEALIDQHQKRQLQLAFGQAWSMALDDTATSSAIIEHAEQMLFQIKREEKQGPVDLGAIAYKAIDEVEAAAKSTGGLSGVPTGLKVLDEHTGGWQNGEFIVIAARPGKGKTGLAINFGLGSALSAIIEKRTKFLMFSIEMKATAIMKRILASVAGVNSHRLRHGKLEDREWAALQKAIMTVISAHSFIDDRSYITPMEMRATTRRYIEKEGVGLVLIDYLQKVKPSKDYSSREQEVASISRELSSMAKELDIPVICLAQIGRGVESGGDKKPRKPMLSDLRESGAIEADASMVYAIHHDEESTLSNEQYVKVDLVNLKFREGPQDDIEILFNKPLSRFEDIVPSGLVLRREVSGQQLPMAKDGGAF